MKVLIWLGVFGLYYLIGERIAIRKARKDFKKKYCDYFSKIIIGYRPGFIGYNEEEDNIFTKKAKKDIKKQRKLFLLISLIPFLWGAILFWKIYRIELVTIAEELYFGSERHKSVEPTESQLSIMKYPEKMKYIKIEY